MKDTPEIAPEIRGLLEEIVADPRSSMRLAPRRALRSWFSSDETIRPSEISGTRAERHLVEAYREELAELLYEAARIAYWKAPFLPMHRSLVGGVPIDTRRVEPEWTIRARTSLKGADAKAEGVRLLAQCLDGVDAALLEPLVRCAVSLAPSIRARLCVVVAVARRDVARAQQLLQRLVVPAVPAEERCEMLSIRGGLSCFVNEHSQALEAYETAALLGSKGYIQRFYSFNLRCFLGDEKGALEQGRELGRQVDAQDHALQEGVGFVRGWVKQQSASSLARARATAERVIDRVSDPARMLIEGYVS